jgi:flagellar biosynthesis protein FlhG
LRSASQDQAEGLRRILTGQTSRQLAFLSAVPAAEKNAVLLNLAAALAKAGSEVHLLDACQTAQGVSVCTPPHLASSLWDVAQQRCTAEDAFLEHGPGVHIAKLADVPLSQQPHQAADIDKVSQVLRDSFAKVNFALPRRTWWC